MTVGKINITKKGDIDFNGRFAGISGFRRTLNTLLMLSAVLVLGKDIYRHDGISIT